MSLFKRKDIVGLSVGSANVFSWRRKKEIQPMKRDVFTLKVSPFISENLFIEFTLFSFTMKMFVRRFSLWRI
jgi:hypothetical protein